MLDFRSNFAIPEISLMVLIDLLWYKMTRYKMIGTKFYKITKLKMTGTKITKFKMTGLKFKMTGTKFKMIGTKFQKSAGGRKSIWPKTTTFR